MKIAKIAFLAALFYALSPGVIVALPPGASHQVQIATHAVVFAVVATFTWKVAKKYLKY
jgi:hypothetical protein